MNEKTFREILEVTMKRKKEFIAFEYIQAIELLNEVEKILHKGSLVGKYNVMRHFLSNDLEKILVTIMEDGGAE